MSIHYRRPTSSSTMSDRSIPTRKRRTTSSTNSSGAIFEESEGEGWDDDEEIPTMGSRRKKKDEPTSPIVVVFYVTAVYLVFQILTRSDDMEILSHLPSTSSLRSTIQHNLGGSNLHSDLGQTHHPYAWPHHLPHIPSPIPHTPQEGSTSFFRILLGVLFYPFYLVISIIAIPIPLLLNLLQALFAALVVLLYPLTSTARLMFRTFVLVPWGLFESILSTFYPVYTFVGGVIGLGCAMGLGAGYIGRLGLRWILGESSQSHGKDFKRGARSSRSTRSEKTKGSHRSSKRKAAQDEDRTRARSTSGSGPEVIQTPTYRDFPEATFPIKQKGKQRGDHDDYHDRDDYGRGPRIAHRGDGCATAREPQVVGTRRRTHGFGSS